MEYYGGEPQYDARYDKYRPGCVGGPLIFMFASNLFAGIAGVFGLLSGTFGFFGAALIGLILGAALVLWLRFRD
jgi:hypothetical protein